MRNPELIASLKEIQQQEGLTDGEMAKRLGCARQLWQATKTGKISVGLTILRGAVKAFPALIGDAIIFLTDGADIKALPADVSTRLYEKPQDKNLARLWRWLRAKVKELWIRG